MGGLLKSPAAPRFISIYLPRNGYRMKHHLSSVISDTWTWELFRKENEYEYMTSRVCYIYLSTKINQYSFESTAKEKVFAKAIFLKVAAKST